MIFRIIWICGLILTVIIFIIALYWYNLESKEIKLPENYNATKVQLLLIVSIITFDALTTTRTAYNIYNDLKYSSFRFFLHLFVFCLFIAFEITCCFYIKLKFFYKTISKVGLIILLIISIVGWGGIFYLHNSNKEVATETFTETEERKLLSFYKVPIQDVSGYIGHYSGKITSTDEIPYWYLDDTTHKGLYDSAPASDSEIIFIQDDETSYLEIVTSTTVTTEYNNNDGTQRTLDEETSKQYKFYLPKSQFE